MGITFTLTYADLLLIGVSALFGFVVSPASRRLQRRFVHLPPRVVTAVVALSALALALPTAYALRAWWLWRWWGVRGTPITAAALFVVCLVTHAARQAWFDIEGWEMKPPEPDPWAEVVRAVFSVVTVLLLLWFMGFFKSVV